MSKKKATISLVVDADVNQNEFKNWLKSCPFSAEGDQTIAWENLPEPEKAADEGEDAKTEDGEEKAA